ncbi:hypothetical protein GCM10010168_49210 [Actinoplanes ianthinogenes]|uniref:Uncharacterized protein n=1 Tax=Actinoplanes ianthinogenes TaxID=122358 RepID=A0ABN6CLP7_9ACTN|nr:DUF6518 family protein [Actinoplanes ianthinogenes]BCJ45973.1 hypothetical protein Aiant_66300 [Actinoplanes ianthinogenes]GGR25471.1 hypothetical protein GCM10010168_49210 [Actinoplanes ianthinogenes]
MTIDQSTVPQRDTSGIRAASATLAALAAGVLLGALDFVWIKFVPAPLGGLGNSMAVWATAAFLFTFRARWTLPVSALAATVLLVVAVPSYYLAAALIQHDAWSNLWNATAMVWMGFGVIAGLVFGAGGALARGRARIPESFRDVALALPGSVLFAEAGLQVTRIGDPSYAAGDLMAAFGVLIILGLGITAWVAPTWRRRGLVLVYALPLTAAGFALLSVVGFR